MHAAATPFGEFFSVCIVGLQLNVIHNNYTCTISIYVFTLENMPYINASKEEMIRSFFFALQEIMQVDNALLQLPKFNVLVNNYNNSR